MQKYHEQVIFTYSHLSQTSPLGQIASSLRRPPRVIPRFSQAFLNPFSNRAIWFLTEVPKWVAAFPSFFVTRGWNLGSDTRTFGLSSCSALTWIFRSQNLFFEAKFLAE